MRIRTYDLAALYVFILAAFMACVIFDAWHNVNSYGKVAGISGSITLVSIIVLFVSKGRYQRAGKFAEIIFILALATLVAAIYVGVAIPEFVQRIP